MITHGYKQQKSRIQKQYRIKDPVSKAKQIERGKKKEGGEGTYRLKDTEETIT